MYHCIHPLPRQPAFFQRGLRISTDRPDLAGENQTVKVPQIGTTLTGDLDHMANAGADEIVLTDVIAYEGFIPGKEYVATGTLMDKEVL